MTLKHGKQILAILVVPTLLSLGLLVVVLRDALHGWAVDRWSNDHVAFAAALQKRVDMEIGGATDLLALAARSSDFASLPERRRIDRAINGLPERLDPNKRRTLEHLLRHGTFSVLFVLTPEGDHYLSHPYATQLKLKRHNLANRPYFQEARATKRPALSDGFRGADGIPAIVIDVPVLDAKGDIVMHLGGVMHLSKVSRMLTSEHIAPFDRAALLDRQGKRIAESDPARLDAEPTEPLRSHWRLDSSGTLDAPHDAGPIAIAPLNDGGGERWLSYDARLDTGWNLLLFRKESLLLESVSSQVWKATALAAFIVILPSLLGLMLALRLNRRLLAKDEALKRANASLEQRVAERTVELQKSEIRHRSLFESTGDAVCIIDENGLIDCNPETVRVFGGGSREAMLGLHPGALSPPAQPDGENSRVAAERHIAQAIEQGRHLFEWTHWRLDDHREFPASVLLGRMEIDGKIFLQATMRDTSEQKALYRLLENRKEHLETLVSERTQELAHALEAARLADKTKDAFLANISHELRTPLNAVIGMAELARDAGGTPQQLDYLGKIVRSGRHLNRIVNELLDLSKIAAGRMEIEIVPFCMRDLLNRALDLMAHRAKEKSLTLSGTVSSEVPDVLKGDPVRIEQIVLNLIGNAIKFTPAGGVAVRVGVVRVESSHATLDIEVEDSGIGIKPDELERLFQPFVQADVSISRTYGGTGLGLAISRQLASLMGGDISVRPAEGGGTVFVVGLRLEIGASCDLPAAPSASTGRLPGRYDNARVLLVEDQELNREIVVALLDAVGVATCQACDGQQALDILRREGPQAFDLVLMDVQMPVMDGLTATQTLRAWPGYDKLPVIALTAHTMAHEMEKGRAAGVSDHLGKPFEKAAFYRTVARWIPPEKQIDQPPAPEPIATTALTTALTDIAGLDVASALPRFGGREERYRHWLRDFANEVAAVNANVSRQIAQRQTDAAIATVHTLKGRVGMLGMPDLHQKALALERALRGGQPTTMQLDELIGAITAMGERLTLALDNPQPPDSKPEPTRFAWSDSYSVGVAELDAQHRQLIAILNQIADCVESRDADRFDRFHEILANLFDYARTHFHAEEAYMARIDFPDLPEHRGEHEVFFDQTTRFNLDAVEGEENMRSVFEFLHRWLLGHILGSDRRYREYAAETRR